MVSARHWGRLSIAPRVAISSDKKRACTSMKIWELHQDANPMYRELLVVGGLFGEISGLGYNHVPDIKDRLCSILDNGANISVVLQELKAELWANFVEASKLNRESLSDSLRQVEYLYGSVERTYAVANDEKGRIKVFTGDVFPITKCGLFPDCVFLVNDEARSYSADISSILTNRFREGRPGKYNIHECYNKDLDHLFGEAEKEKFDTCRNTVYAEWENRVKAEESLYSHENP